MLLDRVRLRAWAWPAGVALISAALFASTFDPRVDGGDAPESVAGVHSVGILHAPGYPAYVLLARAFSWVIPFGSLSARVNLFSTVCAISAVVLVYAIGREIGVPKPAAAVGALSLATATSFWFYAGFAKFYPLTSLLLAGAILSILRWGRGGSLWLLALAGACLGLASGASYQVVALALPGIVLGVLLFRRGVLRPAAAGVLAAAVVSVGLWGFVYVRAGQDPAVNWGDASSFDRLVALISMRDFGWGAASFTSVGDQDARIAVTDLSRFPVQLGRYGLLLVREFSLALVVLAAAGAWGSFRRISRPAASLLAGIFAVNILGALFAVGIGRPTGFDTGLVYGGFVLAASLVLALWIAIGAWMGLDAVQRWMVSTADQGRRRDRAQRRAALARRADVVAAGLAVVLLAGPALAHHGPASHDGGVSEAYAADVLSAVPADGVLFVAGADAGFPLQYAQIVEGMRPDVDVVDAVGIVAPWYCEQVKERLDLRTEECGRTLIEMVIEADDRPVAFDSASTSFAARAYAVEPRGLISIVVPGEPGVREVDAAAHAELVAAMDLTRVEGLADEWPFRSVAAAYVRALIDLAAPLAEQERYLEVQSVLEQAEAIDPEDELVQRNLEALARQSS